MQFFLNQYLYEGLGRIMLPQGWTLGRYRILRFLAKGTSEVYLAEDLRIPGKEVAIKVMQTERTQLPNTIMLNDALNEFQREAQIISKLGSHAHILSLFDYGQETINGIIYIYLVMPYQPEGTLADWLRQRSVNGVCVLTPVEANNILRLAADALQHAHDRNVVHRDVKPSNFLIGTTKATVVLGYPHLLLADFGIARLDQSVSTTKPIGTPYFMAPEQWKGHPVPATDQYALAIMIFYLITGQYPFTGDMPTLAISHTKEKPPRPTTLNPQLSKELDTVLLRALEKNPNKRYSSVTEFAEAFDKVAALPPPPPPDPNKPGKGNIGHRVLRQTSSGPKTIVFALIALIILLGTSGGIVFSHYQYTINSHNATATASTANQTVIAQNNATGTAKANASATAQANATATAQVISTATAQASATAAAQATAIAQGQLVEPTASEAINEHFGKDDATNPYGWQSQNGANFNCTLSKVGYSLTETAKKSSEACFAENQSFNDFTYQVAFKIIGGDCAGIVFRADRGNANYYAFYICTNHFFYFSKYANNQTTPTFDTGSSNNIRTGPTDINVIAVVAKGDGLHFFVNSNQFIYSTPDSSYTGGEIGVIAVDQSKPTSVVFLTAQVYNL